jgi:hypothetical protein
MNPMDNLKDAPTIIMFLIVSGSILREIFAYLKDKKKAEIEMQINSQNEEAHKSKAELLRQKDFIIVENFRDQRELSKKTIEAIDSMVNGKKELRQDMAQLPERIAGYIRK